MSELVRYAHYVLTCQFYFGSFPKPRSYKLQWHSKTRLTCQRTGKCYLINQPI